MKDEVLLFKFYGSENKKGSKGWRFPHTQIFDCLIPGESAEVRTICSIKYFQFNDISRLLSSPSIPIFSHKMRQDLETTDHTTFPTEGSLTSEVAMTVPPSRRPLRFPDDPLSSIEVGLLEIFSDSTGREDDKS